MINNPSVEDLTAKGINRYELVDRHGQMRAAHHRRICGTARLCRKTDRAQGDRQVD